MSKKKETDLVVVPSASVRALTARLVEGIARGGSARRAGELWEAAAQRDIVALQLLDGEVLSAEERLTQLELIEKEGRIVERAIKAADRAFQAEQAALRPKPLGKVLAGSSTVVDETEDDVSEDDLAVEAYMRRKHASSKATDVP